jgi:hypothetical protein
MEDLCSCRPLIADTLYTDHFGKIRDVGFRVDMGACRAQIERDIEE